MQTWPEPRQPEDIFNHYEPPRGFRAVFWFFLFCVLAFAGGVLFMIIEAVIHAS